MLLDLSRNRLLNINADLWVGLQSLTTLSLGVNGINTLNTKAFYGLDKLKYLTLSDSEFTDVRGQWFEGLHSLERLFLSRNKIHCIESGAFVNLTKLDQLELGTNKLTTISEDIFDLGNFENRRAILLVIDRNPLYCDSRLCWLNQATQNDRIKFVSNSAPQCVNYPDVHWYNIYLDYPLRKWDNLGFPKFHCNRQAHFPTPKVWFGNHGYSLGMINICQIIPWIQFDYNLRMPNHTLENENIGYGFAVTPG